jgi:hypothetical protein
MEIVEKTPTRLYLRDDLSKYFIAAMILFSFAWSAFSIVELLQPTQMQLNCQKSAIATDCQVTIQNVLNPHARTQNIQLHQVRLEKRRRQPPIILLYTNQGILTSPPDNAAYDLEQKIHHLLKQSDSNTLQAELSVAWSAYPSKLISLVIVLGSWMMFLIFPVQTEWHFEQDLDGNLVDRGRTSGKIYGRFKGLGWQRYVQYEFDDVIRLGTEVRIGKGTQNSLYHIGFQIRPSRNISLSPSGVSEDEWHEITQAISEILQIAPPRLPRKN